jgi:AmiR/NasT family two-component response regulator
MHRPVQNFRGRSALLMMADDRNCWALRDILEKLGVALCRCEPQGSDAQTQGLVEAADVIIADMDMLEAAIVPLLANAAAPVIALIGHETPSRLQRAFDIEPSSVLMKPVGHNGVFTSLFFAFNEHQRWRQIRDKLVNTQERLSARRIVVKAIIQLMQSFGFDDEEAYRYLRKESMRKRISVEELSAQLVACGQDRQRNHSTGA